MANVQKRTSHKSLTLKRFLHIYVDKRGAIRSNANEIIKNAESAGQAKNVMFGSNTNKSISGT